MKHAQVRPAHPLVAVHIYNAPVYQNAPSSGIAWLSFTAAALSILKTLFS